MGRITAMLTLALIILMLSLSSMNTVHAATMSGKFTWSRIDAGSLTFQNGTVVYLGKDTVVYQGPFSGSSNATDREYSHPAGEPGSIAMAETFIGSFNGSEQGSIDFQGLGHYEGYGEPNYLAVSFSHGTGGLTGLQGTFTRQSPGGTCDIGATACTFQGTYTVKSARWENTPVPEFSSLTLPITLVFFASILCLTTLRRRKTW